jgi:hypothetical protein
MRFVLCAVSAIALSGCSWLGGFQGKPKQGYHQTQAYGAYGQQQSYQFGHQAKADPCQILSPQQPIPRGCDPAQVTIATGPYGAQMGATNGFPQQPRFGQPNYATNNYGSHAGVAHQQGANHQRNVPNLRKPKFRGTLSLGGEKSFSGDVLDYATYPTDITSGLPASPSGGYDPRLFDEGNVSAESNNGETTTTTTTYTAGNRDRFDATPSGLLFDSVDEPTISLDDAWSTPARIAIGGEYILSKNNTVFFNAGYSAAEGKTGTISTVNATLYNVVNEVTTDDATGAVLSDITNVGFVPDEDIARFSADFSDMKRFDLEVGGRHYFDAWNKQSGLNTVTPFIGAAVGASHYNSVSYSIGQSQRFYERAYTTPDNPDNDQYYSVDGNERTVDLYNSQWVPSGQLNVGAEWQVTPRTGLAVETGVRIEGARKYLNDEKGDTNIAIPFTIRGSYNF